MNRACFSKKFHRILIYTVELTFNCRLIRGNWVTRNGQSVSLEILTNKVLAHELAAFMLKINSSPVVSTVGIKVGVIVSSDIFKNEELGACRYVWFMHTVIWSIDLTLSCWYRCGKHGWQCCEIIWCRQHGWWPSSTLSVYQSAGWMFDVSD